MKKVDPCEKLPKKLLYETFQPASNQDLSKLCQTSKKCNQRLCKDENFWKYKIQVEFSKYRDIKPHALTYIEFYKRLVSAGPLYRNKEKLHDRILKVRDYSDEFYFIDSLGGLYVHGWIVNDSPMYPLFPENIKNKKSVQEPVKFLDGIQDIAVATSDSAALILSLDGKLYGIGEKFDSVEKPKLLVENVREIFGTEFLPFFGYITVDNKLYARLENKKFTPIADNVYSGILFREFNLHRDDVNGILSTLYFTTLDHVMWSYKPSLVFNRMDNITLGEESFNAGDFEIGRCLIGLLKNVEEFAITNDYIGILNKGKFKIIPRNIFEPFSFNRDQEQDPNIPREAYAYRYPKDIKPPNETYQNINVKKIMGSNYRISVIDTNNKLYTIDPENLTLSFIEDDVQDASPTQGVSDSWIIYKI